CKDVTNNGINAVFKLKKLTTLIINYLYGVTGTALVLSTFVPLKVLRCRNCHFVGDSGAIELLQNAPYLEEIDLSGTSISKRFLDVACNVANSRGNIIPLKIIVSSALELDWVKPLLCRSESFIVEGRADSTWESDRDDDDLSDSYFFDDEDDIDDDDYSCWGSEFFDSDEDFIEGLPRAYKQNQPDTNLKMPPKELQNRKQQNKSIKVNSDKSLSLPTINILDNDCLIKIFSYLSIKDRTRIERVCKRWQTVTQHAWSDIKELQIPAALNFIGSHSVKINTTERALDKLLLRCGRFLNKLKFKNNDTHCRIDIIPLIAKHCHNLQCLTIYLNDESNPDMTWALHNLYQIERLELFGINQKFIDVCIKELSTNSMKELSLSSNLYGYPNARPSIQITSEGAFVILTMKNLWKLELNQFSFKEDELELIVCNESITYLSLENCDFENCINLIANLRRLKYLNLSNVVAVNDYFLIELAANCTELEEINIENCRNVSNDGITAVFKLKKLTTLIIDELHVTDTVFSGFVALKVLHCRNCVYVSDVGAIKLLQNAPYLEEIDLSGTSISIRFLDVACNVANSRGDIIPLKIIVSSVLEKKWNRPECISESVLIVKGQSENKNLCCYIYNPEYINSYNLYYKDVPENDYLNRRNVHYTGDGSWRFHCNFPALPSFRPTY
ncbi:hypothetical protein PV325_004317, partial [Microctonus aethiopoides]